MGVQNASPSLPGPCPISPAHLLPPADQRSPTTGPGEMGDDATEAADPLATWKGLICMRSVPAVHGTLGNNWTPLGPDPVNLCTVSCLLGISLGRRSEGFLPPLGCGRDEKPGGCTCSLDVTVASILCATPLQSVQRMAAMSLPCPYSPVYPLNADPDSSLHVLSPLLSSHWWLSSRMCPSTRRGVERYVFPTSPGDTDPHALWRGHLGSRCKNAS